MYKFTAVETAYIRPMEVQARQNSNIERGCGQKPHHLTKEVLTNDSFWERESLCSLSV